MTLIKQDIVRKLSQCAYISDKQAKTLIDKLLDLVKSELASKNDVLISGFGQFQIKHKSPRMGRNPKTLEEYEISERDVVVFNPSKVFRNEMKADLM